MPRNTQYALIAGVIVALVGLIGVGFALTSGDDDAADMLGDIATSTDSTEAGAVGGAGSAAVRLQTDSVSLYDTDGTLLVHYRDSGFIPIVVSIKAGHSIRFWNDSSKPLWVTPDANQSEKDRYYRDLDQGKSIAGGQSFTLNMNSVGVFPFKNLNNTAHTG